MQFACVCFAVFLVRPTFEAVRDTLATHRFFQTSGESCKTRMTACFNSSDPVAVNAGLLYDDNAEDGDLWSRGGQSGPLPLCSASSAPPDSRCLVCRDRIVFAVCRNLTHAVEMMMEAEGHQVKISKSECPKLRSDDAPQWQLPVYIILLFLLIGVLLFICGKCYRKSKKQRRNTTISHGNLAPPMGWMRDSDSVEQQKLAYLWEILPTGRSCVQQSPDLPSVPERNGKQLTRKDTTEGESLARTDQTP